MDPSLTQEQFVALAERHAVVPVAVEVLGDRETPIGLFERLAGDADGFLLESVEGGERWGRWSFVGWDPAFTVRSEDGATSCDRPDVSIPQGDPLTVLDGLVSRYSTPPAAAVGLGPDAPPLHTGAVGYLGYDVVRAIEHLPNRPHDDRMLPEMLWQFVGAIAAVDRLHNRVTMIRNVFVGEDPAGQYDEARAALAADIARLGDPLPHHVGPQPQFTARAAAGQNMTRAAFEAAVERAIAYIEAGDAFQVVPSLRFDVAYDGDAFAVYRALRLVNPSPFMFFVRSGALAVAGSSPELMSRVRDGIAYSRPIAGTRPRGADPEHDAALERELLDDPKEVAEHVMLIDLARNDLGRVCEYGTVSVDELMVIERYSHVMHIVSGVSGTVRPGLGPVDVLRATFPHGTVSGAPKVRAMEIIDELEPTARGPYAGAVGYVDFSGNLDTAIALRTMVASGTTAWVQAGAGIVADSQAASEYDECVNKAAAVLAAIAAAEELR